MQRKIRIATNRRITLSHTVTIKTEVRDAAAVRAACQRLTLPAPVQGKHELFSGEVEGLAVKLPDWNYPVVCDLATGQVKFDNYKGRWGDRSISTNSYRRMPWRRPRSKHVAGGTASRRPPRPTARSSSSSRSTEVPHEPNHRNHRQRQGRNHRHDQGLHRSSCRDASKFIEQALGQRVGETAHRRVPPDQPIASNQQQRQ